VEFLSKDIPGSGGVLYPDVDDFIVNEEIAYAPSGEGEHLFIQIEKTKLTTAEVSASLSEALDVKPKAVSFAGFKDKHARTRQWFSVHYPIKLGLPNLLELDSENCRVLDMERHRAKLKRSHGKGNRFVITVREVPAGGVENARASLERLREVGVPNIFGAQRFGKYGDNVERGLQMIRKQIKPPGNHRIRSILQSAVQSEIFNRIFNLRLEQGVFFTALAGDIMKKHDTGGLFDVTDPAIEQERIDRLEISPTAPLPGRETRYAKSRAYEFEQQAISELGVTEQDLSRMEVGTRRSLRFPLDPTAKIHELDEDSYALEISLPSGAYATVVLAELIKPESGVVKRKFDESD